MSPQKINPKPDECTIDMPITCQDDTSNYTLLKTFADNDRYPSQSSSLDSNSADICRICHCEGGPDLPLITPCYCSGSLRYVHQTCLQQWIKSSNIRSCELCKFQFIMQTKVKPFNEWEYLDMSGLERKKLACAMLFHIIAMTCVCWSLYVLIDRTLDEVRKGHLEWPFWTKLIVVGIGFMGGIVFMYIQCRAYFVLCQRWKAYNRVIYVQNAPEKLRSQSSKPHINSFEKDNVPGCSFKTHSDTCGKRDNIQETNCIDIKGVRNLRIFFGEENQIRVSEGQALTQQEQCEDIARVVSKSDKSNHLYGNTSLHIQIGNSDRSCRNSITNSSESKACSSALCPSDCKQKSELTEENYGNKKEFKGDQSVVKLQIKKAEIVIEFGKHNNSETLKCSNNIARKNDACNGIEIMNSPKRKFSSEEYLDSEMKYNEKVANEANESPASQLLINTRSSKVPFNNFFKERATLKDWKSSEDLLDVKTFVSKF